MENTWGDRNPCILYNIVGNIAVQGTSNPKYYISRGPSPRYKGVIYDFERYRVKRPPNKLETIHPAARKTHEGRKKKEFIKIRQ